MGAGLGLGGELGGGREQHVRRVCSLRSSRLALGFAGDPPPGSAARAPSGNLLPVAVSPPFQWVSLPRRCFSMLDCVRMTSGFNLCSFSSVGFRFSTGILKPGKLLARGY